MWQNRNKIGGQTGGLDLINYSELHHPLSHHNVSINNEKLLVFPSDLLVARTNVEFV